MKLKSFLILLLFYIPTFLLAQNYSGQVLDSITKQPIPFVAIQLEGTSTGVISNDDGRFSLYLENPEDNYLLNISCMGYTTASVSLRDLKNNDGIIFLSEHINELDMVFLSTENINIDSIIKRANRNLKANYPIGSTDYKVFHRKTTHVNFKNLNFDIDKASGLRKSKLEGANKSLDSLAREIKRSNMVQFTDYLGNYYYKDSDNRKLKVDKATVLMDKKKDFSPEGVQKKGSEIILKYLDPNKSYKIKSGWFKMEDSLSLSEEFKDQKEEMENQTLDVEYLNNELSGQIAKANLGTSENFIRGILDRKYYDFELLDITFYMNDMVYVVKFLPRKSSAKYSGTHYISSTDYGILRTDYQFAEGKRGQNVNLKLLLGIKFIENISKGTMIFNKNDQGAYQLKYAYSDKGGYIYLHRPIKFIENSSDRNKVSFDVLFEGNMSEKLELLVVNSKPLSESNYNSIKQVEKTPYQELKSYDPSYWSDYNVLEPVAEMKQFKSIE